MPNRKHGGRQGYDAEKTSGVKRYATFHLLKTGFQKRVDKRIKLVILYSEAVPKPG
jgi:hypothetical protein